jgi:phytoene synthase
MLAGRPAVMGTSSDQAQLETILRRGSKSFHLASRLLPERIRGAVLALYAFCRQADDLVDDSVAGAPALAAVQRLRGRIDRVYRGGTRLGPVERAFAQVADEHRLPRVVLDWLVEGMTWDAEGRVYRTSADVRDYAVRVAGTVGVLMTLLMTPRAAKRDRAMLGRAIDLGVAMQLTNIARDVGEDARAGRVYLPLSWIGEEGRAELLRAPQPSERIRQATARLLTDAERCYRQADEGIDHLPVDCQPAIRAARRVYAEIGAVVQARGFDGVSSRAVVGTGRKLWLAAAAHAARPRSPVALEGEPSAEGAALIDAVLA